MQQIWKHKEKKRWVCVPLHKKCRALTYILLNIPSYASPNHNTNTELLWTIKNSQTRRSITSKAPVRLFKLCWNWGLRIMERKSFSVRWDSGRKGKSVCTTEGSSSTPWKFQHKAGISVRIAHHRFKLASKFIDRYIYVSIDTYRSYNIIWR